MEMAADNGLTRSYSRQVCSFYGCTRNKARHPSLHFYSFPVTRPSVCDAWVANCANDKLVGILKHTLSKKIVCEKHFTKDSFLNRRRTRLKKNAVPTLRSAEVQNEPEQSSLHQVLSCPSYASRMVLCTEKKEALEISKKRCLDGVAEEKLATSSGIPSFNIVKNLNQETDGIELSTQLTMPVQRIKCDLVEVKQEELSMDEECSNNSLVLQPAEGISCNTNAKEKEGGPSSTVQIEEAVDMPFETIYCQDIFPKVEIKVEDIDDCEPEMTITSQPEEDDAFVEPDVLTYPSKKIASHGLNLAPVVTESVIGTEKKCSSRKTCAMTGCEVNQARFPGLHFFKFPVSRPEICEQWVASCANEALDSLSKAALRAKLVCEKHFTNDSFTSTLKTRLKINAIPTNLETSSSPTTPLPEEVTSLSQSSKETPFIPPACRTQSKTKSSLFSSPLQGPTTPLYKKYRSVKKQRLMPTKTDSSGKQKVLKRQHSKKKLKHARDRTKEKSKNISSDVVLKALQSCPPEKVEIKVEVSEDYEPVATITSQPEEKDTAFVEKEVLTYSSKKNASRGLNLGLVKECDHPEEDMTDIQLNETEEMHIIDPSELASSSFNPLKRLDSEVSSATNKHAARPVFKVCQLCENQCFSTYKDLMDHYKSRHHIYSDVVIVQFLEDNVKYECPLWKVKDNTILKVSDVRQVKWKDSKYYLASITKLRSDGAIEVEFIDDKIRYTTTMNNVRHDGTVHVGDVRLVQWTDGKYYNARILSKQTNHQGRTTTAVNCNRKRKKDASKDNTRGKLTATTLDTTPTDPLVPDEPTKETTPPADTAIKRTTPLSLLAPPMESDTTQNAGPVGNVIITQIAASYDSTLVVPNTTTIPISSNSTPVDNDSTEQDHVDTALTKLTTVSCDTNLIITNVVSLDTTSTKQSFTYMDTISITSTDAAHVNTASTMEQLSLVDTVMTTPDTITVDTMPNSSHGESTPTASSVDTAPTDAAVYCTLTAVPLVSYADNPEEGLSDRLLFSPTFSDSLDDVSLDTEYCPSPLNTDSSESSFSIISETSSKDKNTNEANNISNLSGVKSVPLKSRENVADLNISDTDESNSQAAKKITKKNKNFCYFCETKVLDFSRHVIRHHSYEPYVQEILATKKGRDRNELFSQLRKKGNYLNAHEGDTKPVKKLTVQSPSKIAACPYCSGFYSKRQLWRHKKCCSMNTKKSLPNSLPDPRDLLTEKRLSDLISKVFPRMHDSIPNRAAKKDSLICAFGEKFLKTHTQKHQATTCSRKMRELAFILLEIKEINPSVKNLMQALRPENFDDLVEAAKRAAGFNCITSQYRDPSYAMNICKSLKECCELAITNAIKRKQTLQGQIYEKLKAELNTTLLLLRSNWRTEICDSAADQLHSNKMNNLSIVPRANDLKILRYYLIEMGEDLVNKLHIEPLNKVAFKGLVEVSYCRVLLMCRKRPGELQRMSIDSYNSGKCQETFDEFNECIVTESILLKRFKRVVVKGKRKAVPVLFSPDVQKHIEILMKIREKFVLNRNNYLFPQIGTENPILGYRVLQKHAKLAGCKRPDAVKTRNMRKHLATICQIFDMKDEEIEQVFSFMGHSAMAHKRNYRLADDVYQIAKIAKILLMMEKGEGAQFHGKTLDEIEVPLEESNSASDVSDDDSPQTDCLVEDILPSVSNQTGMSVSAPTTLKTNLKQKREFHKWTDLQKKVVTKFFECEIKNKIAPKKKKVLELYDKYPNINLPQRWEKVKVFIQNVYTKKLKHV